MNTFTVSFFSSKTDIKPEVLNLDIISIKDKLKEYAISTVNTKKADLPLISGGFYDNGIKSENLKYRSFFIYDLDNYDDNFDIMLKDIEKSLSGYVYLLYTTYSHTYLSPKLRIILFPNSLIEPEIYEAISRSIVTDIFSEKLGKAIDNTSYEATRRMFVPCIGKNKDKDRFIAKYVEGKLLDLSQYGYTYKREDTNTIILDKEVDTISDIELAANHLPLPDVTTDRVKEVLGRYSSADIGYEEWRDVVFALHHQYQGSKEGLDILLEWSLKEDNKRTKENIISGCKTHYKNAKTEDKKRPLTFATIIARVNQFERDKLHIKNLVFPIKKKNGKPISNEFANYKALFAYYNVKPWYNQVKKRVDLDIDHIEYNEATNYTENKLYDPNPDRIGTKKLWLWQRCITHKLSSDYNVLLKNLHFIANTYPINPVKESLLKLKWDGVDRLEDFYSILHVSEDWEQMKKIILKKFLKQYIYINCFNEGSIGLRARQVLIFQGKEHIGKSTFMSKLTPTDLSKELYFFDENAEIDLKDRMVYKSLIESSIVELGELDDVLISKKYSGKIKNFISKTKDKVDLKYITDHLETRRLTVFTGTINRPQFLDIEEENTRFLPLPIKKIEYVDFDIMQIYAQLLEEIKIELPIYRKNNPGKEISPLYELNEEERKKLKSLCAIFNKLDRAMYIVDLYIDLTNKDKNGQAKGVKDRRPGDILNEIRKLDSSVKNDRKTSGQLAEILRIHGFKVSIRGGYRVFIFGIDPYIEDDNTITSDTILEEDINEDQYQIEQNPTENIDIQKVDKIRKESTVTEVLITDVKYELIDKKTRLLHFKNYSVSDITYGIDIETTGLNPINSRVALLQIYNPAIDKIFIYKLYDAPLTNEEKQILSEIRFVAHNASFERSFMPYLKNLDCSMIAYHASTSSKRCGLSDLSLETGITYNNKKVMQTSDWSGELTEEQLEYAAKDAKATYILWQKYKDNNKPVYDRMYKASFIIDDYSKRGLPVDIEAFKKLKLDTENKKDELLQKLIDLGFEEIITPARNIRTKKELMAKVTPDVMKIVEEVRSTNSLLNNMISGVEENIINDRLPINTLICGTETGRLATVKPNVQNFPRSGFRHIFKARDGYRFIRADFSGQELRMVAAMSNEKVLIEAFNAGKDPHAIMAARLNNMPLKEFMEKPIDWQKSERQKAKAANFGFLYGMGASRFIDNAKDNYNVVLTEEEATTIKTKFWSTYSFLKRWSDKERADCRARGYALTKGGRKRFFEDMDKAYCEMINTAVQGSCGEVLLETLISLPDYLKGYLVNTVHDELVFEVPIELIQDEAKYIEIKNHITGAMIAGVRKVEPRYPTLNITEIKDTDRL